jgi:heme exporter protein C
VRKFDLTLLILAAVTLTALFYAVFLVVPNERTMGFVQKIFYIHVPCAWVAFLAFGVTGWKGFRFLQTRDMSHDISASASAEVGLVFVSLVLITGPLWAKPVWGIYWTWDLRLTTTFVLWLLFVAYMVLRRSIEDPERRATLSAVVGLIGFLDVPVVYLANRVKATQHPAPVVGGSDDSGLATGFALTFTLGLIAITLVYFILYRLRRDVARLEVATENEIVDRMRSQGASS